MPRLCTPSLLLGLAILSALPLLAVRPAQAQGAPRSVSDCERLKNDLAYNQCLALFGPGLVLCRRKSWAVLYLLLAAVVLAVMPTFTLVALLVKQHFGGGAAQAVAALPEHGRGLAVLGQVADQAADESGPRSGGDAPRVGEQAALEVSVRDSSGRTTGTYSRTCPTSRATASTCPWAIPSSISNSIASRTPRSPAPPAVAVKTSTS